MSKVTKAQVRAIEKAYAKRVTRWAANKAQAQGKIFNNERLLWQRVVKDSWKRS